MNTTRSCMVGLPPLGWKLAWAIAAALLMAPTVAASADEFQCAPAGAAAKLPIADKFYDTEVGAWAQITQSRYLEGDRKCSDVVVPGYEGFPTKRCAYSSVDAGAKKFEPLAAQAVVLDPSSNQLAAWSISACRTNGASDTAMPKCLNGLRNRIKGSNGAQFPVVGSVVESYCNSSSKHGECSSLPASSRWRRPRHTWFRDGVSVDYQSSFHLKWDSRTYSASKFDEVLDATKSDPHLDKTYAIARVASADRDEWRAWRKHVGKPEMPDGVPGSVEDSGWRAVSSFVHKAACKAASNELFDAVVFSTPAWTKD